MSFLSDLLGTTINTSGLKKATKNLAAAYGPAAQQATVPLQQGLQGTIGAFDKATGKEVGALTGGETAGVSALTGGQTGAINALTGGMAGGLAPWLSLFNQGQAGTDLYGGFLGLGGQFGGGGATGAFEASPYGQQLQSSLGTMGEAVARGAGTSGQTGQGYLDAANQALGLTSQAEQGFLGSLSPYFGEQQAGAQGISNVFGQFAPDISNVYTGTGANLANLYQGTGQNIAQAYGNQAAGIAAGYGLYDPLMSQINWQGALGGPATMLGGAQQIAGLQGQQGANTMQGLSALANLFGSGAKAYFGGPTAAAAPAAT